MHIEKFSFQGGLQVVKHCQRDRDENCKFGNEAIDPSRSSLNKNLLGIKTSSETFVPFRSYTETVRFWAKKTEETTNRAIQTTANFLVSAVITLPEDYRPPVGVNWADWYKNKEHTLREDSFFSAVASFFKKKFGVLAKDKDGKVISNMVYVCVHRDETTPHLHVGFIPVLKETVRHNKRNKDGKEREVISRAGTICACEVVNRNVLQTLHQELDTHLRDMLPWYVGGVLLDDDARMRKGQNVAMKELKNLPQEYTSMRTEANRLDALVQTVKDLRKNKKEIEACKQEVQELLKPENMPPVVALVEQLCRDGKLTNGDVMRSPTYAEAVKAYRDYHKTIKAVKKRLSSLEKGGRDDI